MECRCRGVQALQPYHVPLDSRKLCGHHVIGSSRLPSTAPGRWIYWIQQLSRDFQPSNSHRASPRGRRRISPRIVVFLRAPVASARTPPNRELFVISWDLQTGGVASIIGWQSPTLSDTGTPSATYSANGKMVGVYYYSDSSNDPDVFTFDVASGTLIQSYSLNDTAPLSNLFWTHGESLRFATVDTVTITIWEVGFASGAARKEVETLPTPADGFDHEHKNVQLLPAPFRLALIRQGGRVQVWDARNSRYLLDSGADANFSRGCPFPPMVVSSHARLPDQTFISGRSLLPAIYFTEYSPPAPHILFRSSPETESRSSRFAVARSDYGVRRIFPPPPPVF